MRVPHLSIEQINFGCFAINDGDRTVAIVTPQGYIDWVQISPDDEAARIREVPCPTHLCYVMGLKIVLHLPHICDLHDSPAKCEIAPDGASLRLTADSHDAAGSWRGHHEATLAVNPVTRRYEWSLKTSLACVADKPVVPAKNWIEFNNVYPGTVGRCMLFAPQKTHSSTIMVDRDGVAWKFPHQHSMHYTFKINRLDFADGTIAGFFGEAMNPVVEIKKSAFVPDWAICDMYYDLHCGCRVPRAIEPGETLSWDYTVRYLDAAESEKIAGHARHIPVEAEDYRKFYYPRLALGRNDFKRPVTIDGLEDADCFRTNPPVKVWDRETGPAESGSLRIFNDSPRETAWQAEPPNQVPPSTRLRLTALVKTSGVVGKGMFIRLRPHRFSWLPKPHVDEFAVLESEPVTGTSDWVRVTTPELRVPADIQDMLTWIEVVLDGEGTAWLADVGVDLQGVYEDAPISPVLKPVSR